MALDIRRFAVQMSMVSAAYALSAPTYAESSGSVATKQEQIDRATDEMAASSRETAILSLKRMLKLKRGTPEEPMLLWRLADMEWRSSKSYFRVGVTSGAGDGKIDADHRVRQMLEDCVAHATEVLTRFPKFPAYRDVLVRRGRAYEELKRKDYALRDFTDYIEKFPEEQRTVEVRLMASDVLADQNLHLEILKVLKPVNVDQDLAGLESQVVDKQALANYHIGNYSEALRKAEWLLHYDRVHGLNKEVGGHFDEVIAKTALFYGTAFAKRLPGYSLEHAMDYFKKLDAGEIFARISHEFVLVMRSKEMQSETIAWKDLALQRAPKTYGTLWTLVDVYDAVVAWKDHEHFKDIYKDFDGFLKTNPNAVLKAQSEEWFKKFKKTLIEYAGQIFGTLPKTNAGLNDYKGIQIPYLLALNTMIRVADPRDELRARVRFRIGEFYSNLREWDRAQAAFTDVYQGKLFVVKDAELREQARMRAITARYDAFKEKGVVPQDLKAVKLESRKKTLSADVTEWIRWVDEVSARKTRQAEVEVMDKLLFEANRVIYASGDTSSAYKRMLNYIGTRPNSKLTPAVCALVIDTLIASEAWVATRTLAMKFQQMPNVATGDFKAKLIQLEQDSHFKITVGFYKSKDYLKAKAFGDEHLKLYPDSKYKVEIFAMMGRISLELKDTESSLAYLNQVIQMDPKNEAIGLAYFTRATDAEKKFNFKQAFEDYTRVFSLPADKRGIADAELPALKKKLFVLGLVAEDEKIKDSILNSEDYCGQSSSDGLRSECDRLRAVTSIEDPSDKRTAWTFIELGRKAPKDAQAAWYAAALARGSALPNSVIVSTAEDFKKTYSFLDAMTQMEVLAALPRTISLAYSKKMEIVETNSELARRADDLQRTLNKRVHDVQGLERVAAALLGLPSPEMRIKILGTLSAAYAKIADHLKGVQVPKGFSEEESAVFKQAIAQLLEPLSEKLAQIGKQQWEIAKAGGLVTPWWSEAFEKDYAPLYSEYEQTWDPERAYFDGLSELGRGSAWASALKQKHSRPAIFFFQISQTAQVEKLKLDESDRVLLQLATLRSMGLDAESNAFLKERESTLKGSALRLGALTRLHSEVVSRSIDGIRASRKSFLSRRVDTRGGDEEKILKLADRIEQKASAEEAKSRTPASIKIPANVPDSVPESESKR